MGQKDKRTYITVHDGMPDHEKVEGLSDKAFRVLIKCWCWCARNKTDGFIKQASWVERGPAKVLQELMDAGLAEVVSGGVAMHDYLKHQRSAAEIDELSQKRAEAGSKGGKANAQANAQAKARAGAKQTASKSVAYTYTDKEPNLSTAVGLRNAGELEKPQPATSGASAIVGRYVRAAHGVPPLESQERVERSARSLLAQGYDFETIANAAENAGRDGWTDLATQVTRDNARAAAANGKRGTADQRVTDWLTIADNLENGETA